ncbi:hypothetical protein [Shewanella marina]|uniref:hypothetical protein n=1 Tax=Shewanella marina TaxID=487319 RepID=UPI000470E4C9|nr:hypothetical protein [Shewanella marina]
MAVNVANDWQVISNTQANITQSSSATRLWQFAATPEIYSSQLVLVAANIKPPQPSQQTPELTLYNLSQDSINKPQLLASVTSLINKIALITASPYPAQQLNIVVAPAPINITPMTPATLMLRPEQLTSPQLTSILAQQLSQQWFGIKVADKPQTKGLTMASPLILQPLSVEKLTIMTLLANKQNAY